MLVGALLFLSKLGGQKSRIISRDLGNAHLSQVNLSEHESEVQLDVYPHSFEQGILKGEVSQYC